MRKPHLSLALAALCLLAVACSDDDPVKPEDFAVVIQVNDPAGNPVEGLRVGLANDHAYFQDGFSAAKAMVKIPFRTTMDVGIRLTIEDIEGEVIRVVDEGDISAGSHLRGWDGKNNAGVHQPSGRFTAHLVATNVETGYGVFEGRVDMLLSVREYIPNGYTDQDGRLVLKDRRLFPHLYDRSDLVATNENGESLGLFNLIPLMRISLIDTAGDGTNRHGRTG